MYLQYYINENGDKVYTTKVCDNYPCLTSFVFKNTLAERYYLFVEIEIFMYWSEFWLNVPLVGLE